MFSMRIHRYLYREISAPVFLSLLIFTFMLLMGRIPRLIEMVVSKGVPLSQIVQLFSYLLPSFLSITFPLSFLLGILLAFGRLSADGEFIALKASGISLYSLLKPVLVVAVLFSAMTAWLTISVEPASRSAFRGKLLEIASTRTTAGIRPGIFNDDFDGLVLYTREMDDRQGIMQGVFISDEREGEIPATITARQGRFISDPENFSLTLRLNEGSIHRHPQQGKKSTYQIISFNNYDINLDIDRQLTPDKQRKRKRSELSWAELSRAEAEETSLNKKSQFAAEKYERVAIALAPLVLALVGVPLGLQSNRSGKGAGFALALCITLVYYVLLSLGSTLAANGLLPAALALMLPNLCFFVGGSYFLHRTAIERPMAFLNWPVRLVRICKNIFKRKGQKR